MSISDKLNQIIQIKSDIKDAIADKGVEMPAGLPFNQYASKVSEIKDGASQYTTTLNIPTNRAVFMGNGTLYTTDTTSGLVYGEYDISDIDNCTHCEVNIRFAYLTDTQFKTILFIGLTPSGGYYDDPQYGLTFNREYSTCTLLAGDNGWFANIDISPNLSIRHEYDVKIVYDINTGYEILVKDLTLGETEFTRRGYSSNTRHFKLYKGSPSNCIGIASNTFHAPYYNSFYIYDLAKTNVEYILPDGTKKEIKFAEPIK